MHGDNTLIKYAAPNSTFCCNFVCFVVCVITGLAYKWRSRLRNESGALARVHVVEAKLAELFSLRIFLNVNEMYFTFNMSHIWTRV